MTRGLSDFLDVKSSNALLHRGCPRIRSRQDTGHVGDEWHHSRHSEHKIWVLRNQGCARYNGVVLLFEELKPPPLDFSGLHLLLLG